MERNCGSKFLIDLTKKDLDCVFMLSLFRHTAFTQKTILGLNIVFLRLKIVVKVRIQRLGKYILTDIYADIHVQIYSQKTHTVFCLLTTLVYK
jgi:hypothetical protein